MIVIRADGNKNIGMGHIGRCLCVAKALKKLNIDILWIISSDSDSESIASEKIDFVRAKESSQTVFNTDLRECIEKKRVTCVLLDSYNIKQNELDLLSQIVPVYYIDDLNMFDYNVAGIINYNFEAAEKMYLNTQFKQRKLFMGPKYFPLNYELWSVPRCEIKKVVKKVLITSGSTDPMRCIEKIMCRINPQQHLEMEFHILLGKFFADDYTSVLLEKYSTADNVQFIRWGRDIAELYKDVDILIAPGATMIFEALALGIPCISFMFADNQRMQCNIMRKTEIAPCIGDFREGAMEINDIFETFILYEPRKRAQTLFSNLIDENGAQRIASILTGI